MAQRLRARLLGARRVYVCGLVFVCLFAAGWSGAVAQSPNPLVTLANGWGARDLGSVLFPGATAHLNGAVAIAASGKDINKKSDEFHFTYVAATGDVDIVTRLVAVENRRVRAGAMIRASLEPHAAHAYVFLAGRRVDLRSRRVLGGDTAQTRGVRTEVPVWMKLERRGPIVSAYSSPDGKAWRFVGSEALTLPSTFYVGLAVTSRRAKSLSIAAFDRVEVIGTSSANGGLELPGEFAPPPQSTGSGGRSGGGGGSSKPKPKPKPKLKPSPTPTAIAFGPSPDHQRNVDAYILEVVAIDGDETVVRTNIGKPAVVNGECIVDIRGLLADLPAGQYVGRVRAVNSDGSSAAAVSPAFTL